MNIRNETLEHGPAARAEPRARQHGLIREGIITGVIGAVAVAVWFLVVDLLRGQPLHTPALLGAVVTGAADPIAAAESPGRLGLVALYTLVHAIAFAVVGVIAVFLVHRAERAPALIGLLLMLFAAIEVAFTGFVALLEVRALGDIAWYQVAVGNLVAAVSMGWYLWRSHPDVRHGFAHQFDG